MGKNDSVFARLKISKADGSYVKEIARIEKQNLMKAGWKRIWLLYWVHLILISAPLICAAQSSFEFWPEVDVWYRLTPSWRLSAFVPVTKYYESKYRDLNICLQAEYAWGKTKHPFYARLMDENRELKMKGWMARVGFMEGWSLGQNAGAYTEDMLYAEIHKRVPLKGEVLLSQRFRTDLRWVGNDPKFSYRFRYRIMVEKEFTAARSSIVPYVSAEPFWDSRYATVNRIRLIAGTTVSWGHRFAYEANITYQYDEHYDTNNTYALNIILHVYFETARSKSAAKKVAENNLIFSESN